MENMDMELTVLKWVLIVWPKTPQMPQKISDQNVCPSWLSVVRGQKHPHEAVWLRPWGTVTGNCLLFFQKTILHFSLKTEWRMVLITNDSHYWVTIDKKSFYLCWFG